MHDESVAVWQTTTYTIISEDTRLFYKCMFFISVAPVILYHFQCTIHPFILAILQSNKSRRAAIKVHFAHLTGIFTRHIAGALPAHTWYLHLCTDNWILQVPVHFQSMLSVFLSPHLLFATLPPWLYRCSTINKNHWYFNNCEKLGSTVSVKYVRPRCMFSMGFTTRYLQQD